MGHAGDTVILAPPQFRHPRPKIPSESGIPPGDAKITNSAEHSRLGQVKTTTTPPKNHSAPSQSSAPTNSTAPSKQYQHPRKHSQSKTNRSIQVRAATLKTESRAEIPRTNTHMAPFKAPCALIY